MLLTYRNRGIIYTLQGESRDLLLLVPDKNAPLSDCSGDFWLLTEYTVPQQPEHIDDVLYPLQ